MKPFARALLFALALLVPTVTQLAVAQAQAAPDRVEVWKSPSCGCCGGWVDHMRAAGFAVTVHEVDDLEPVKRSGGVPEALGSCHTALVDGYVIEGHVPAGDVRRLLSERPAARGLSVPGMPMDAPGMDMATGEPYETILFGASGGDRVFARH
ncbi:DUF411 domain-containing protein [Arenibaculum sp.]|uniref:DUF411 domain-containing protein n=1 Tax=Arenibaculum sp. TaxID=2865862 RepID=UPI002E0F02CF|nr:DUF411 domain-containing protein [Arenibaculum sp.]